MKSNHHSKYHKSSSYGGLNNIPLIIIFCVAVFVKTGIKALPDILNVKNKAPATLPSPATLPVKTTVKDSSDELDYEFEFIYDE